MTTIIVTHEDNETDEFEFNSSKFAITLGRRTSNDVCISDLSVSGNHATLSITESGTVLEDLNSTNGSYVNGQVIQRMAINPGDEIILGKILISVSVDTLAKNVPLPDESSDSDMKDADYQPCQESSKVAGVESVSSTAANDAQDNKDTDKSDIEQSHPVRNSPPGHSQRNQPAESFDMDGDTATAIRPTAATASPKIAKAPQRSEAIVKQSADRAHPLDGLEHLVVPTVKPTVTPMHELDSSSIKSKGAVIEIKNGAKSGQILPIDKPVTTLGRPGIQIAAIMRKPNGYFLMHIESDNSVEKPTLNKDTIGDEPVLLHSGDELTVAGIDVEFMLS